MANAEWKALVAKVRELGDPRDEVTADKDLVYDIGLAGDDLERLLAWLHQVHGVDFSAIRKGDLPLNEPPQRLHTLFGNKRKFKSMTIGRLVEAMTSKRWSWT